MQAEPERAPVAKKFRGQKFIRDTNMKKLYILLLVLFLIFSDNSVASAQVVYPKNYQCTGANGAALGWGRLSARGEFNAFLGRASRAGEFVVFQYKAGGKEYWFNAAKCRRVK